MTRKVSTAVLMGVSFVLTLVAIGGATRSQQDNRGAPPGLPKTKGGGPGGFGPGTFLAPAVLEAADANQDGKLSPEEASNAAAKLVREADIDKKGSVDAATLGKAINKNIPPPPGMEGPGGPPPGFGPGTFMAPQILAAADANKDGRLSPEEASEAASKFVRDIDVDKKGLDANSLAGAMNRRMRPPGGGGPGGMGGPGGPMGPARVLVKTFDKDKNGRLNLVERKAARDSLKKDGGGRRGPGFGPPPGMFGGEEMEAPKPGLRVDPAQVKTYSEKPLYDPSVVRTLFFEFEDKGWEAELADFYKSDVEVPATLTVDGKKYPGVGVHFRGMSSYFTVKEGFKRSMNVSIDFENSGQRLLGYKTLNLLNSHEDPTFMHTVLYLDIARNFTPAPKANFVRVVINGESWGLYVNAQQYDKKFLTDFFPGSGGKGTRWKVQGSPGGDGGLNYVGEDIAEYKRRYTLKSGDDDKVWKDLIALCKTLDQTPPEKLEAALKPILDVEGTLWFLALENALINGDGYWVRASDYCIYRDPNGLFHIITHDANETFQPAMTFGFGGGPGRGPGGPGGRPGGPGVGPGGRPDAGPRSSGIDLDPLVGLDDNRKALRSRLLAVPALKARYLAHVRTIAEDWLDWNKLGPIVERYRALIEEEVEADTRKLSTLGAFQKSVADAPAGSDQPPRGRTAMSLRAFAEGRRKFLLDHPEIKKLTP